MESARNDFRGFADSSSLRASHGLDDAVLADVRAVGAVMGPRVSELIDDFYRWLMGLPEFAHFFASEKLLAHVKRQQTSYWLDFLRAEIDETYVERRRVVGQVHARIELGLLIYLQAMEFASAWLRNKLESEPLLRQHPQSLFAIRKLIKFDSAIVVDTYARRTAARLGEQRQRLEYVAGVMRAVTEGDLSHLIAETGPEDPLGESLNGMVKSLRNIAREMDLIARGDYSAHVAPRSDKDVLGASLQAMTRALRDAAERNEQFMWMAKSQAELSQAMTGNPSVTELSQRLLVYLCRTLEVQVAAHYVLDQGTKTLRITATYAAAAGVPERLKLGEGLVGQAALEKRPIFVNHIPEDSIRVSWGLGQALPKHLVIFPLLHENEVRGVLELGTFAALSRQKLELLERAAANMALALTAAETRAQIEQLLEESRAQGQELAAQQEELRQVNERLEEQARALVAQKDSLLATETVLRQKATELERASRYKSEFLANMSHELRTPLNSSLLLAKLLADNKPGNLTPEQVKYAQSISSAGNDLLTLINDILDLSKIEAGKVELIVEQVPVARIMQNLRHRFEPLIAEKKLAFEISTAADCPVMIDTDEQRLQQILTNLLSNAVKFTERGMIRLRAGIAPFDPQRVAFFVEDTGIGIATEQHEIVFEAFRQADGTTNRKFGGTGLGLSISRELAALLGGDLRLRSSLGQGSTFTVTLPRRTTAPAPRPVEKKAEPVLQRALEVKDAARSAATQGSEDPVKAGPPAPAERELQAGAEHPVLIIEDDPSFVEILRSFAQEFDFSTIVAGTADEGLRLARRYGPIAILLDIGLPDQSGLGVLEMLKRDPATRHIPVHMVSVYDCQRVARELGAAGYVLKPAKREQLTAALQDLKSRLARKDKAILIIEDNATQREAMATLLAAANIRIVIATTVDEGLVQLRGARFDCIVLDLMLPGMSGFELLDRMGAEEGLSSAPVIVYTARSISFEEERRLQRLSQSIIIKGARSPERLLEEVTLFLHVAESELSPDKQRLLKTARERESVFEGRRILLVEDDARNIFALTAVLEQRGAVIDIARNGREALARLEQPPAIDIVLMDVMMPEMDGLAATREIRKRQTSAALPIIALTAKAMADDRQSCIAAGMNDYVSKPIDIEKLLALLRVWMPR